MKILLFVAGLVSSLAMIDTAQADQRCRQAQIVVYNQTGQTIRIFRLRYVDIEDAMLRTNDIPNVDVPNGGGMGVIETLEYVGNEPIGDISIEYRIGTSGQRVWSDLRPSNVERCVRGITITHLID